MQGYGQLQGGPNQMQRFAQAQGGAHGQLQDFGAQGHQLQAQGGYGQAQGGYGGVQAQAPIPIAPLPPAPIPLVPVGGFSQAQGFGVGGGQMQGFAVGGIDHLEDEIRMMVRHF